MYSPMAHIASQLMDNADIRLLNTLIMGAQPEVTIPKRPHVDWSYFPDKSRCDNGLIMWFPLEESEPDKNGLYITRKTHKFIEANLKKEPLNIFTKPNDENPTL